MSNITELNMAYEPSLTINDKNLSTSLSINFTYLVFADQLKNDMIQLKLIEKILFIINFLFIVLGTFGNLFTFAILMRKNVPQTAMLGWVKKNCFL
jgi:hypothetical protein